MADRLVPVPFFPLPPQEYNQQYFAEVVRAISFYFEQNANPGEGRNTFSVFTDLQENDVGLEPGTIFNYRGYVKITQINSTHPTGTRATGQVGSVTITDL
jgi:hypothetical protein